MKIGLLGGTFNPPHLGHLLIAQQVLDFTDCEAVWLVPTFRNTFEKPTVSPQHRLAMVERLIQNQSVTEDGQKKITVSTLEIDHQLNGETIQLLPHLPTEHEYCFVIGSDQLPTFHLWGEWKALLENMPFLVFPRYGYPNEPLYQNMQMVNDDALIVSNISSTKIRQRKLKHLTIEMFTSAEVSSYIDDQGLYI